MAFGACVALYKSMTDKTLTEVSEQIKTFVSIAHDSYARSAACEALVNVLNRRFPYSIFLALEDNAGPYVELFISNVVAEDIESGAMSCPFVAIIELADRYGIRLGGCKVDFESRSGVTFHFSVESGVR